MFLAAEKLDAVEAQRIGLVDAVVENPIAEAEKQLSTFSSLHASAT
jgi:enoyl-CoA hydratase/carnithine racemase